MKDLCKIQAGPERESPHLMPGPLETTCLMACREEVFSSRSDTGRSCSVRTGTICQVVSSSRSHGDLVGMRSPGRRVSGRKVTRPLDMTPSQWASCCRSRCRKAMQRACALWYDRIWERTQEWKSGYRSIKPSKPLVAFAPGKLMAGDSRHRPASNNSSGT